MKSFLIIGIGRFGYSLAKHLWELGNEVVAVDRSQARIDDIVAHVTHAMVADATSEHVLQSLGVQNFDCVIVAFSGGLEDSILSTVILKNMGVENLYAKARDDLHIKVLEKLGVERIFAPEIDMGKRIAQRLTARNLLDYIEISEDHNLIELLCPERWIGKSIRQLNVRAHYGANILVIKTLDKTKLISPPNPDYVFEQGDVIVLVAHNKDVEKINRL